MPFERLPSWKDENPITYEKQQISNELRRLRRMPDADPERIKELRARYAVLDGPHKKKRQAAAAAYFKRSGKKD